MIGPVRDEHGAVGVTATSYGVRSRAAVAAPPSPVNPAVPVPATVEIVPVQGDLTDAVVPGVGDVEIAGRVERQAYRGIHPSRGRRSTVTGETRRTGAGDGGHGPVDVDPAHGMVRTVGNVDAVLCISGQAPLVEPHRHRCPPSAPP